MLGSISEISIKVPWYSPFKQPVNVFVDGLALHFKLKVFFELDPLGRLHGYV